MINKYPKPDDYINNLLFTYVQKSSIHGYGIFASQDLIPNTCLGELDGQIISWNLYHSIMNTSNNLPPTYKHYFFMEWN